MMKSKEQIKQETDFARAFDISLIADSFGYEFKRSSNYLICKSEKNLVLFPGTNSFFNYYGNFGGTGIDFVMHELKCDVKTAIEYICNLGGNTRQQTISRQHDVKCERKDLVFPEKNDNHRRVFAYLVSSRKIDKDVVVKMLHNKLVYESRVNHNAIFVGYDKYGVARHGFMRGTISDVVYRGDVIGSDKSYGFAVPSESKSNELIVFEGPIDLMSYMSLKKDNNAHLIALGMLSDEPIYRYLQEYPNIDSVSLCLDNDSPGIEAKKKFATKLIENGFKVKDNYIFDLLAENACKDVNELICKIKKDDKKKVVCKKY